MEENIYYHIHRIDKEIDDKWCEGATIKYRK